MKRLKKKWNKLVYLPLISDIKILRGYIISVQNKFIKNRIEKNSCYNPSLFIFMQNKTRSCYESMFTIILNICKDRYLSPKPTYLNMNIEITVINAAK